MSGAVALNALNRMTTEEFVALLGGVFEKSPWVAQQAEAARPFASVAALHAAMALSIENAGIQAQLALICAHPELAGKAAIAGELTEESTREQAGAGLSHCTPEQFSELHRLNAAYNQRFGHPFILAVRGYDRTGILGEFSRRVLAEPEQERRECLRQIYRIGQLRLADLVVDP